MRARWLGGGGGGGAAGGRGTTHTGDTAVRGPLLSAVFYPPEDILEPHLYASYELQKYAGGTGL